MSWDAPPPQGLANALATLNTWGDNFTRNTSSAFANMSATGYIRLLVAICGYLLLRPYLIKLGAHLQMKYHKEEEARTEEERAAAAAANELRGGRVVIPGEESEDEDGGWGHGARVRQRRRVRKIVEEHEQKLAEKGNESDADIEELLEE
ncbi:hypothetical protein EJ06DRAFT_525450 [Trichodelitschia bisporula]|uniref:DUF1531-domain-containing protein n=1 Tax=Trichodelitschia bisporula TaxID=703511 RepID=A0A6G1IA73_9PEZI|nr:hypothetical protein EJ06DRAFT_525450 [Trichodelitschia bisporula]